MTLVFSCSLGIKINFNLLLLMPVIINVTASITSVQLYLVVVIIITGNCMSISILNLKYSVPELTPLCRSSRLCATELTADHQVVIPRF